MAYESKASWGYDAGFMEASRVALEVPLSLIEVERVILAEGPDGTPLGFAGYDGLPAALDKPESRADLTHLFVAPSAQGQGVGKAIFEEIIARARADGFELLEILSDPGAQAFYEKMGAGYLEEQPSDVIAGRRLPFLLYRLD